MSLERKFSVFSKAWILTFGLGCDHRHLFPPPGGKDIRERPGTMMMILVMDDVEMCLLCGSTKMESAWL